MGDELPSLHRKFKIRRSLFLPSSPSDDLRKLVKNLLNFHYRKVLIVDVSLYWKTTTTYVDHLGFILLLHPVIPVKTGIQTPSLQKQGTIQGNWIPASAGMTKGDTWGITKNSLK
jgi:hypothetical protein